ncbi:hypothetical protein [Endozoicomonas sp. ALC066]|uniref:hypothetical protein n=1 Tax=Endozoicomonas sp. ALC066 TaxID=3403078 RepID=UPI003BB69BAD
MNNKNTPNQNAFIIRSQVHEMFKDFEKSIFEEGGKLDRLLKSSAIDLSEPIEDYRLAKMIIQAIAKEMENQYELPLNLQFKGYRKELKNLYANL